MSFTWASDMSSMAPKLYLEGVILITENPTFSHFLSDFFSLKILFTSSLIPFTKSTNDMSLCRIPNLVESEYFAKSYFLFLLE